ncbi:hypothetical protein WA026_023272 [Henosepilachna vigintioctopunctata]|uniref:HTH psq-type domain-containing protein n=1 Tax=Henosepilachna vigintioctopunctata TaxID=420089 RepID=A0AAW1V252_9CUCU
MDKRQYKTWSSDVMEKDLSAYKDGRLKFNEICRVFNIPKQTFRRSLKGLIMHENIRRPKYLTEAMEDELVNHILELESRFFVVTIRDSRHLAYQSAAKYGLPHKFNPESKLAGWKCVNGGCQSWVTYTSNLCNELIMSATEIDNYDENQNSPSSYKPSENKRCYNLIVPVIVCLIFLVTALIFALIFSRLKLSRQSCICKCPELLRNAPVNETMQ